MQKSKRVGAYAYVVHLDESAEGIVYVAEHPELPGCMAHGATPTEAKTNLDEARSLYLADMVGRGLPVPEPHGALKVVSLGMQAQSSLTTVEGGATLQPAGQMPQLRPVGEEPVPVA